MTVYCSGSEEGLLFDGADSPANFDAVIQSCQLGLRKPDPAIYRAALEALGVTADEAVFLDDIGSNLVGAADIGIATIKVPVSPDELSVALDQLQSYTGVDLGSTLFSFNRLLLVMYFAMITFFILWEQHKSNKQLLEHFLLEKNIGNSAVKLSLFTIPCRPRSCRHVFDPRGYGARHCPPDRLPVYHIGPGHHRLGRSSVPARPVQPHLSGDPHHQSPSWQETCGSAQETPRHTIAWSTRSGEGVQGDGGPGESGSAGAQPHRLVHRRIRLGDTVLPHGLRQGQGTQRSFPTWDDTKRKVSINIYSTPTISLSLFRMHPFLNKEILFLLQNRLPLL